VGKKGKKKRNTKKQKNKKKQKNEKKKTCGVGTRFRVLLINQKHQ
jgi:hypothetical protein